MEQRFGDGLTTWYSKMFGYLRADPGARFLAKVPSKVKKSPDEELGQLLGVEMSSEEVTAAPQDSSEETSSESSDDESSGEPEEEDDI